jgi:hypothetical protein
MDKFITTVILDEILPDGTRHIIEHHDLVKKYPYKEYLIEFRKREHVEDKERWMDEGEIAYNDLTCTITKGALPIAVHHWHSIEEALPIAEKFIDFLIRKNDKEAIC